MPRRSIACALLLWNLAACTTWHSSGAASVKDVLAARPSTVRITLTRGGHKVLHLPRIIDGDSVQGFHKGDPYRYAVADITQIATPTPSVGKSIALGVGIMTVFAVTGVLLTNRDKHAGVPGANLSAPEVP